MTKEGLIDHIIEALGFDLDQSVPRGNPCLKAPLTKDLDGYPCHGTFCYANVVGMLLNLAGHTCLDIAYSVFQVVRFIFSPKHLHKQVFKHNGRYLLKMRNKD